MNSKKRLRENLSHTAHNPILSWGIAAAGFALLIAIHAKSPKSQLLLNAAKTLAVALPVSIGTSLFSRVVEEYKQSAARNIISVATFTGFALAQLAIVWSVYLFLSDIDRSIGRIFIGSSIFTFLISVLPYL